MIVVLGCLVWQLSFSIAADSSPDPPLSINDGNYATETTRLSASWTASPSAPPGGFDLYRFAIGTTPDDPGLFADVYPIVLTIGNSITYNGPMPVYGWYGSWGIEASAAENDYVHRMLARLRAASPLNAIACFSSNSAGQPGGKLADVLTKIETFRSYHANLITIQMGENDSGLTMQQFRDKYAEILDKLLANTPRPQIVCFGPWSSRSTYDASTREAQADQIIADLAAERGIVFRSVKRVALNPANNNPGHALVQWHPNDRGHQGYADIFQDAIGGYYSDWQTTSATSASVDNVWLIDGMTYYWYVQGRDSAGVWQDVCASDGVLADTTPPDAPTVWDGGAYTNNLSLLACSWSSQDATTPIAEYKYAIGTRSTDPGSGYVVGWKSAGTNTSAWENISSLVPGTCYYFYVKARNAAGLWSPVSVSDGIYVLTTGPVSVAEAKLLPDGVACAIKDAVLTVSYEVLGTAYVEEPDRTNGMGFKPTRSAAEGDVLELAGVMSTASSGERLLANSNFRITSHITALSALPLRVKDVPSQNWFYNPANGAGQRGVDGSNAFNLSTIGRLLKVVGKIVSIDSLYIYLSDGSCADNETLRVEKYRLPSTLKVGDYVSVGGLSTSVIADGKCRSLIRPRRSSDCQLQKAAP